jgi:hypothetical protein
MEARPPRDATPVEPVKLFVALLWAEVSALRGALADAQASWGPLDFEGADHLFDVTDYYEREMGEGLRRRIVAFRDLVSPEVLADAKGRAVEIEEKYRAGDRRRVNLDVGYLDHHKVVLASLKPAGQKLYLRDGVWADLQARFARGRYRPFEWTFPDFAGGRYDEELLRIRARYREQLRRA